jgi:hypothetical protein
MNGSDIPELDRITFFPGQRLLARDLSDVQRVDRELRWLHNRSLHTWGIGLGLGVTGEPGDSVVQVSPGYGTDCLGREIILAEPRARPIPAVAGDQQGKAVEFFLVAAYQGDGAQAVEERRAGTCLPDGTVRLAEEPSLTWKKRAGLREGHELVLAQVWILNCRLNRPVSLAVRRSARPSDQPYVAAGQTVPGKTPWTAWTVGGTTLGVSVVVDTSAARFRSTPRYVAHIVGERALPPVPSALAVDFSSLTGATPERFTLNVLLPDMSPLPYNPPPLRNPAVAPDLIRTTLLWRVTWMGVEG